MIIDEPAGRVFAMGHGTMVRDIHRHRSEPTSQGPSSAGAAPEKGEAAHGSGRPKRGVVAREVTLLPRHRNRLSGPLGRSLPGFTWEKTDLAAKLKSAAAKWVK